MGIVEVCGFNDWYLDLLQEMGCREVILVQPEEPSSRKTDRQDAAKLSEQLWVNRHRIAEGKRIQGLRRVILPDRDGLGLRKFDPASMQKESSAGSDSGSNQNFVAELQSATCVSHERVGYEESVLLAARFNVAHRRGSLGTRPTA